MERNLIQNTDTLSILFENKNNMENITEIVHNLHKKLNLRITIIDVNGVVIADSDKTDLTQIDNHINRKEIIQARYNEIGKDRRKSETIDKNLLYVAKKVTISNDVCCDCHYHCVGRNGRTGALQCLFNWRMYHYRFYLSCVW